jgi:hypothetical protein
LLQIEINSLLWWFPFACGNLNWRVEQMEAGMKGGSTFGGWQHCRGRTLYILIVNIALVGFLRLEAF